VADLTPTVTHSGASISPDGAALGSDINPHTYTVTAVDGTTKGYTVTVNVASGITISGITVAGLDALTLSVAPSSPVNASTSIIITISGGVTVSAWYIEVNGPGTPTSYTTNTFTAPSVSGFYNVNVFATVGGVDYSGSFGLVVN
jgi:phage baseplate assembly protein gpV